MANNPIHLTILRRGDVHIVDLAEVQTIIPRSETRVDGAFLEEISEEIKRITNVVGPDFRKAAVSLEPEARRNPYVVKQLKNLGSLIFSHLLTEAARDRLRRAESSNLYLRLDDQLVHIPWELAFDGQQFLGMKFRVGRQVITHHKAPQLAPRKAVADSLQVLIVSDPSETLKNVSSESEKLCEILDGIPGLRVRFLGGRGVRRIPLLAALRESDVVHFAGHSHFDEQNPENSGWLLHDGLLSASEISKLDQAPLLVFSNSCQAGATKNWQGDYLFEGQAFGLGSAFLLAGVRNYIGTFCVVHDEESRFLAVEFYTRFAEGKSIGQAVLEARLATAEEMGLDRLTWASYMLYGDPEFTFAGLQPPAVIPSREHGQDKIDSAAHEPGLSERPTREIAKEEPAPALRRSHIAWLSGGLLAAGLAGFLLVMWWSPAREVPSPAPPSVSQTQIEPRSASRSEVEVAPTPPSVVVGGAHRKPQTEEVESASTPPRQPETAQKTASQAGEPPTVADSRSSVEEPSLPPTRPKLNQDLKDITVELDNFQVASNDGKVIAFLRIFNKTAKELAILLGHSAGLVVDNRGSTYELQGFSGVERNSWTYVPAASHHTISMTFGRFGSRPQMDSVYSISAEIVLAPKDDVRGIRIVQRPDTARTVNISLHNIKAQ